jgi:hypothetical protein
LSSFKHGDTSLANRVKLSVVTWCNKYAASIIIRRLSYPAHTLMELGDLAIHLVGSASEHHTEIHELLCGSGPVVDHITRTRARLSFAPPTCWMPLALSQASPKLAPEDGSTPGFDISAERPDQRHPRRARHQPSFAESHPRISIPFIDPGYSSSYNPKTKSTVAWR